MPELFDKIRAAVLADHFVVGTHADDRLRERRIEEWHIAAGIAEGRLMSERHDTKPNPTVEVEETLPDGMTCMAVWAWLRYNRMAKLVTVHFFDR